jgi:hypothetical protein
LDRKVGDTCAGAASLGSAIAKLLHFSPAPWTVTVTDYSTMAAHR